jgi:hypothetical protein
MGETSILSDCSEHVVCLRIRQVHTILRGLVVADAPLDRIGVYRNRFQRSKNRVNPVYLFENRAYSQDKTEPETVPSYPDML